MTADLATVPANVYGLDWVAAWPDPAHMLERGARFAAIYLKAWNAAWVDRALAAGIAIVPVGEVGETSDSGGAKAGESHGRRWVDLAKKNGVPAGCPIILTHDTSSWFGQISVDYYTAGAHILRDNGYRLGGYGGRKLFGNTPHLDWDLIWAWSAVGADPAPDNPHVQQGTHHSIRRGDTRRMWTGVDFVIDGLVPNLDTVDTNVAKRPFTAWGPPTVKPPAHIDSAPPVVTTPPQPIPMPNLEGDMRNAIIHVQSDPALFLGVVNENGAALTVEWSGPGDDPRTGARIAAHLANGAVELPPVDRTGLQNCTLNGPIPPGWAASDFYRVND